MMDKQQIIYDQADHFEPTPLRGEQIKNQYSTFIEQLEETTEQLMNEVFNTQYQPQTQSPTTKKSKIKRKTPSKPERQGFDKFIVRNNKFLEKKEKFIKDEQQKKKDNISKQYQPIPTILRGSRERLDPIYERALDLQEEKQRNRKFKEVEKKKQQQHQLNGYSFHPQIKTKTKNRTLQQYLEDKETWQQKKLETRKNKKIVEEAKKYTQCLFQPTLISKQTVREGVKGERVEERLLKSLQKSFDLLMG